MTRKSSLDCIVVGHNDVDFGTVEEMLADTRGRSAAYVDLQANSVPFHGRRMTYMSLLNEVLQEATGRPHDLHECELPHLGAAYLTNFLLRRGFAVEKINFFNKDGQRFRDLMETASPRAVAITTTLYVDHAPIREIVSFVRAHNPETLIIVGGPHIFNVCSTQPPLAQDFLFEEIGADIYIFDSQGELTLSQVLEQLRGDGDLSRVPNLIYVADRQGLARTPRQVEKNDMNSEAIDWSRFDAAEYTPTVQTRTARSCAFSCSFCRYPVNAGPLTLTELARLENELSFLRSAGVRNVVFIDDTFNVPLPRFKDICRLMIRRNFGLNWYSFFRASNSDDEAIDLMVESGCKGVFLGLESGDPGILKNMAKHADPDKYRYAIRRLNEVGISSFASIIVGFPGETEETFANTRRFLEETSPTFYRAEIYYHYVNVPIAKRSEELGIKGSGYSWRHRTMDWARAAELVRELYSGLRGPRVLPGYMFDFWALPYLTGKGFTIDQIKDFTAIAQRMLVRGFDTTAAGPDAEEIAGLRAIFSGGG
jgi:radical SAM PhpK family P-methyltransferase